MKIFGIIVLVVFSHSVSAQEKKVVDFTEDTFDFGEVLEEAGPITHEFEFVNNGTTPLIISNVKASCGCTTPGWSKEPVMPGEKGFVKAQYNPLNRPGAFKKSLTITSNAATPTTIIYIQGKVIPRVKTIEEELRIKTGALRMKNKTVNMGRITTEKNGSRKVDTYNDSDVAFTFTEKKVGPDFIKLSFEPATLQPKEKGTLTIDYDPNYQDNLGFQNHNVKFYTTETDEPEKDLNVMATITEYFPPMSAEEERMAPKLQISTRIFDFGKMSKDSSKETSFELVNNGLSELNIRKVVSNCSCVVATVADHNIEPGKSTKLSVKFDSKGRRGNQIKSVTLYSNDPKKPTQIVSVKAQVEKPVQ